MTPKAAVTIYISAASDLMAEREALARLIAGLPVTLNWRILQTPISEMDPLDLGALQGTDLYFLIMGSDIRAPVGLEWLTAQRAGQLGIAYLKRGVPRTPAGQVFISQVGVVWRPFTDVADLGRQVQHVLAEHLVRHAAQYALMPEELTVLETLPTPDVLVEQAGHGEEAGRSAVILSRERFEPGEGVIVDQS